MKQIEAINRKVDLVKMGFTDDEYNARVCEISPKTLGRVLLMGLWILLFCAVGYSEPLSDVEPQVVMTEFGILLISAVTFLQDSDTVEQLQYMLFYNDSYPLKVRVAAYTALIAGILFSSGIGYAMLTDKIGFVVCLVGKWAVYIGLMLAIKKIWELSYNERALDRARRYK